MGRDRDRDRERDKERDEEKRKAKEEETRNKDKEEDRKKKGLPTVKSLQNYVLQKHILPSPDSRGSHDCVQHHSVGWTPIQTCSRR